MRKALSIPGRSLGSNSPVPCMIKFTPANPRKSHSLRSTSVSFGGGGAGVGSNMLNKASIAMTHPMKIKDQPQKSFGCWAIRSNTLSIARKNLLPNTRPLSLTVARL